MKSKCCGADVYQKSPEHDTICKKCGCECWVEGEPEPVEEVCPERETCIADGIMCASTPRVCPIMNKTGKKATGEDKPEQDDVPYEMRRTIKFMEQIWRLGNKHESVEKLILIRAHMIFEMYRQKYAKKDREGVRGILEKELQIKYVLPPHPVAIQMEDTLEIIGIDKAVEEICGKE